MSINRAEQNWPEETEPASHFSIERLPNGYIRVYDYNCQWDGLYNENGTFRHGQARGYERQVRAWLAIQ